MIKVFTAFSGYDSQCMALDRAGIDYDLVGWSEIDRYAIMAHNAVYPQYKDRNYGDISKINWDDVPDFDLFTYSFPCTSISQAGLKEGMDEGSGTKSSLLWECRKAIEHKRPRFLLMENVRNLVGKKFMPYFQEWVAILDNLGYSSNWEIMDAKDFGVPQSRQRVIMVSTLDDRFFQFPEGSPTKLRIRDILEEHPDEKFYFSEEKMRGIIEHCTFKKPQSKIFGNPEIIQVGNIVYDTRTTFSNPNRGRVYSIDGIAATLDTCSGGGRVPKIVVDKPRLDTLPPSQRTILENAYLARPIREYKDFAPTLRAERSGLMVKEKEMEDFTIRYLTPRECFRLMGVSDEDIDKIQNAGISKTQQHKLAGNSIVVDVLVAVFKKLFQTL